MNRLNWESPALRPVLALAAVALVAVVGGSAASCHYRARLAEAVTQADKARQSSAAHAAAGGAYDETAKAQRAQIEYALQETAKAHAETEKAKRELDRLRAKRAADVQPVLPEIASDSDLVIAQAQVIEKQDAEIKAQDAEIKGLRAHVVTITKSSDSWKLSAQESQREALQLRAALAAREGLETSALWKGRIQGFAVGLAGGYVGGRLK